MCTSCSGICLKCDGPTANECSECVAGIFLNAIATTCSNTCPDGTFGDSGLKLCVSCDVKCKTCTSLLICLSCASPFFYNSGTLTCESSCPLS